MNAQTPHEYLKQLQRRLLIIVTAFLAASSFTYWASTDSHVHTKTQFLALCSFYFLYMAWTIAAFIGNVRESRRVRKIMKITLSLFLAFSFLSQPEARAMVMSSSQQTNLITAGVTPDMAEVMTVKLNTSPDPSPKFTLCEAIGGMIVIGVGVIIGVGLYRCAKKCLNPPTNNCPTNCPNNGIQTAGRPARGPQQLKALAADPSDVGWDDTVATNGWLDWTGAPVTSSFGGSITNCYLTNSDGSSTVFSWHSSPDMLKWTQEYLCVTGWCSVTPMGTNTTTIVYDQYGHPFSTNWCTNGVIAGQINKAPIRAESRMFYRISP